MTAIKVVGDYAYIIDITAHGLATYDISNPAKPVRTGLFKVEDVPGDNPEAYSFASISQCGEFPLPGWWRFRSGHRLN